MDSCIKFSITRGSHFLCEKMFAKELPDRYYLASFFIHKGASNILFSY